MAQLIGTWPNSTADTTIQTFQHSLPRVQKDWCMGIANLVAAHKPTENAKLEAHIQPPFFVVSCACNIRHAYVCPSVRLLEFDIKRRAGRVAQVQAKLCIRGDTAVYCLRWSCAVIHVNRFPGTDCRQRACWGASNVESVRRRCNSLCKRIVISMTAT